MSVLRAVPYMMWLGSMFVIPMLLVLLIICGFVFLVWFVIHKCVAASRIGPRRRRG